MRATRLIVACFDLLEMSSLHAYRESGWVQLNWLERPGTHVYMRAIIVAPKLERHN